MNRKTSGKKNTAIPSRHGKPTLAQICNKVIECEDSFEDVFADIERIAYESCEKGKLENVVNRLEKVAFFFEMLENKNDEHCGDLADVYLLIGELCQQFGRVGESVTWFHKAVVVSDRNALPYQRLAQSYTELGETDKAIRSLEQQIHLSPGDYFAYLHLADLYEKLSDDEQVESCLDTLLERDPDNLQALHKLIVHHEKRNPEVNSAFLRKRLLSIHKQYSELEMIIRSYHLYRQGHALDAISEISSWEKRYPDRTILFLVKAFILQFLNNEEDAYAELMRFKKKNGKRPSYVRNKLDEIASIFGTSSMENFKEELFLPKKTA